MINRRGIYLNMAREQNQLPIETKPIGLKELDREYLELKEEIRRNSQLPLLFAKTNQNNNNNVYQREFSCVPNNLDIKAEILKV